MRKIYGIFESRNDATDAFDKLSEMGYGRDDISVITMEEKAESGGGQRVAHAAEAVAERTASGAGMGAAVGGLAGLLIGLGAIVIPGVGALLIGGPIAAALGLTGAAATTAMGAMSGALAGGLIGALTSLGIPEDTARKYETRIRRGAVLLGVDAEDDKVGEVKNLLNSKGASDVTVV